MAFLHGLTSSFLTSIFHRRVTSLSTGLQRHAFFKCKLCFRYSEIALFRHLFFTFCFLVISHTLNISLHGSTATCNFYVFWWFRYSFGHCFCYPQRQDVTSNTFSLGIEFSRRSKRCSYPSSGSLWVHVPRPISFSLALQRARVIDYKRKSIQRYIGSVPLITKENL